MMIILLYCLMITIVGSASMFVVFRYVVNETTWDTEVSNLTTLCIIGAVLWPLTLFLTTFLVPIFVVGHFADKARRKKD